MMENAEKDTAAAAENSAAKPEKKKRKWPKVLAGILGAVIGIPLVAALVVFAVLYGRLASMNSVEKVGDAFYSMNFRQDYALDKALAAEIATEEDLLNFINDQMFFGYGMEANFDKYGCSAFIAPTADGKYLTGRSFGLGGTDKLALYTHPRNGYASISMASLDVMGIGGEDGIEALSPLGRAAMLATPYICVDGMNEKGVCAALLDLGSGEIHEDTDKPDLTSTLAIRLIMDKAANVDEAVALLEQYDFHSVHGYQQHIFISDASGDSVVVEWEMYNEFGGPRGYHMVVTKTPYCTNFEFYLGRTEHMCERYDIIKNDLEGKTEIDGAYAMNTLEKVYQRISPTMFTEWSVVYYQNDFTMDIVIREDFDTVYHLEQKDFK